MQKINSQLKQIENSITLKTESPSVENVIKNKELLCETKIKAFENEYAKEINLKKQTTFNDFEE